MFLLGIMISVAGLVTSLLPALPEGALYWLITLSVVLVYPLVLVPFFRANRADKEFRWLHWMPMFIVVLWLGLELLSMKFEAVHTAQIGFFSLWSLPLVALGLGLTIAFSAHVIRRRQTRITVLTVLLATFASTAYAAQVNNWNPALQAAIFRPNAASTMLVAGYRTLSARLTGAQPPVDSTIAATTDSSMSSIAQASSSSWPSTATMSDASSTVEELAKTKKPRRLVKSGPETIGVLFATLMAVYCMVLHARAMGRMRVDCA